MLTEEDVRARLRAAIEAAGGQRKFAEEHGFTTSYVHDVIHGRRALAARILQALGIKRIVLYQEMEAEEGAK
jgi:DNA-binding transcriptional regulator YdaS (Cro superfamily)